MDWIIQGILSFLAAAAFGVIFNSPRGTLFHCGMVGAAGWLVYYLLTSLEHADVVIASFAGSFAVSLVAHWQAKRFRMPMIIFSVAGIIPLVPGGMAYNTMRKFVEGDYLMGIAYGSKTMMISGAIAMGLVFGEVIFQSIIRTIKTRRANLS
jgi:uncharacterized membrane protein YjjB (DUF3815 family)